MYRPDLIEYNKLSKASPLQNLNNAFNVADQKLGLTPLLDAEGNMNACSAGFCFVIFECFLHYASMCQSVLNLSVLYIESKKTLKETCSVSCTSAEIMLILAYLIWLWMNIVIICLFILASIINGVISSVHLQGWPKNDPTLLSVCQKLANLVQIWCKDYRVM